MVEEGFGGEVHSVDNPGDDGRFVVGKVVSIIVDAVDCDVTESKRVKSEYL